MSTHQIIFTGIEDRKNLKKLIQKIPFADIAVLEFVPKFPRGWKNFKIVETGDGTFTGQIDAGPSITSRWSEKDRKLLAKITKNYLEFFINYKIQKWQGKKK